MEATPRRARVLDVTRRTPAKVSSARQPLDATPATARVLAVKHTPQRRDARAVPLTSISVHSPRVNAHLGEDSLGSSQTIRYGLAAAEAVPAKKGVTRSNSTNAERDVREFDAQIASLSDVLQQLSASKIFADAQAETEADALSCEPVAIEGAIETCSCPQKRKSIFLDGAAIQRKRSAMQRQSLLLKAADAAFRTNLAAPPPRTAIDTKDWAAKAAERMELLRTSSVFGGVGLSVAEKKEEAGREAQVGTGVMRKNQIVPMPKVLQCTPHKRAPSAAGRSSKKVSACRVLKCTPLKPHRVERGLDAVRLSEQKGCNDPQCETDPLALVSGCGAGGDDPLLIASGFGFSPPPAPSLGRSEVYSEKSEVRHVRKSCTKQSDISIALKQGVGQAKLPDQDYLHQSRGKQHGTGVTARILQVKPSPAMKISGRREMTVGTANGERQDGDTCGVIEGNCDPLSLVSGDRGVEALPDPSEAPGASVSVDQSFQFGPATVFRGVDRTPAGSRPTFVHSAAKIPGLQVDRDSIADSELLGPQRGLQSGTRGTAGRRCLWRYVADQASIEPDITIGVPHILDDAAAHTPSVEQPGSTAGREKRTASRPPVGRTEYEADEAREVAVTDEKATVVGALTLAPASGLSKDTAAAQAVTEPLIWGSQRADAQVDAMARAKVGGGWGGKRTLTREISECLQEFCHRDKGWGTPLSFVPNTTAHPRATQSPRSVFSWRELTQGVNDVSLNPIGGTGGSSPLLSMTSPAYSAIGPPSPKSMMVNSGAVRASALSSPAASSACALKGGLDSVGVKMVAGEAIRRLKLEEEEGAESPCVSRVRGMKKLLTAVKSRMGGVHWSNTEDLKGKVLTDSTNKAKKNKNEIVPLSLFEGKKEGAGDASGAAEVGGARRWWDKEAERNEELRQQACINRLRSSVQACKQIARNDPTPATSSAREVTPLDWEKSVQHEKIAEVMRRVGPALNKETACRLLSRAEGDVSVAVAIARAAALPRTPRTRQAGRASFEAGRRTAAANASGGRVLGGSEGDVKQETQTAQRQTHPKTRLLEMAAMNAAAKQSERRMPGHGLTRVQEEVAERKDSGTWNRLGVENEPPEPMQAPWELFDVPAQDGTSACKEGRVVVAYQEPEEPEEQAPRMLPGREMPALATAHDTPYAAAEEKMAVAPEELTVFDILPLGRGSVSPREGDQAGGGRERTGRGDDGRDIGRGAEVAPTPFSKAVQNLAQEMQMLPTKEGARIVGAVRTQPASETAISEPDMLFALGALSGTEGDAGLVSCCGVGMGNQGALSVSISEPDMLFALLGAEAEEDIVSPMQTPAESTALIKQQPLHSAASIHPEHREQCEIERDAAACGDANPDTGATNMPQAQGEGGRLISCSSSSEVHQIVTSLCRTNPLLARLESADLTKLLDGAEVHELEAGSVMSLGDRKMPQGGSLHGVSLLLAGSVRAHYTGEVSCNVKALGAQHLRKVLTPGELVSGDEKLVYTQELRSGACIMPVMLRWSIPSVLTALTSCRLLTFADERAAELLIPAVQAELAALAESLRPLPLFAHVSARDLQLDILAHGALQMLADGAVLASAGTLPSPSSLIHVVISGKVVSALLLDAPDAPRGADGEDEVAGLEKAERKAEYLTREQGPGALVGVSGMVLPGKSRTTVTASGACLVLSLESAEVRRGCFKNVDGVTHLEGLARLKAAATEAARQEEALVQIARGVLPVLRRLAAEVSQLLSSLTRLVGGASSFRTALSAERAEGGAELPPRNVAVVFGCAPLLLEHVVVLEQDLAVLYADGGDGVVALDIERVLPRVAQGMVSIGGDVMASLTATALRSVTEVAMLHGDAEIAACLAAQEEACGKALVELLCAPFVAWPKLVDAMQGVVAVIQGQLPVLEASPMHSSYLSRIVVSADLPKWHANAEACALALHDVGGFLETLEDVPPARPQEGGLICEGDGTPSSAMVGVAPVPEFMYTHAGAGSHHRVLKTADGELLPVTVCVNDVCAGVVVGTACQVRMLNDVVLLCGDGLGAVRCGGFGRPLNLALFYLSEMLILRIRGLANRPYTLVFRTQNDCAPQFIVSFEQEHTITEILALYAACMKQAFQAPCKPLTKQMAALLRVNRILQAEHAALWPYAEDDRFEEGSSAVGVVDIVESCSENDFA